MSTLSDGWSAFLLIQSSSTASDDNSAFDSIQNLVNSTLGLCFGQMSAMMWSMTSGLSNFLNPGTNSTFSCQRRVAHFLIRLRGAYLVTGIHRRRAAFRTMCDTMDVAL